MDHDLMKENDSLRMQINRWQSSYDNIDKQLSKTQKMLYGHKHEFNQQIENSYSARKVSYSVVKHEENTIDCLADVVFTTNLQTGPWTKVCTCKFYWAELIASALNGLSND